MRYLIGILIAIGLVVLTIVLIIKAFSGHKVVSTPLVNYANTDTVMQLTVDGPINADQTHLSYQIAVSRYDTQMRVYLGYLGTVSNQVTYASNSTAYANFLRALDVAGYTKGDKASVNADERGFCPLGQRYVFEINTNGRDSERFWSTSCGQGTFGGKTTTVLNLFTAQIPDFSKLNQGLNFTSTIRF